MSRDEFFDDGRATTPSLVPDHSIFEPAVDPSRRRIHARTDAGVWRSGFLPIRFTSSLSCIGVPVNCGFDDHASATNKHRTVLPAARRRTSLARWLERDCSDQPTDLTCSATNARHVHPTR